MLKQAGMLTLVYAIGVVLICGWSLSHVFSGTLTSDNTAAVVVFPFAWIFGYWGVVGPLVVARKIWKLQASVEEHVDRRAMGLDTQGSAQDLEDTLTLLAVQENPIPERFARIIVRRLLRAEQASEAG